MQKTQKVLCSKILSSFAPYLARLMQAGIYSYYIPSKKALATIRKACAKSLESKQTIKTLT